MAVDIIFRNRSCIYNQLLYETLFSYQQYDKYSPSD